MKTAEHTIVAKGHTTDRISFVIWSDGLVTGRTGERTLARYTWEQLPGVMRAVKKSGKLPISPERSEEIAASNSAARVRALRIEIEHNRNPWAR